jgi:hypothetical protein
MLTGPHRAPPPLAASTLLLAYSTCLQWCRQFVMHRSGLQAVVVNMQTQPRNECSVRVAAVKCWLNGVWQQDSLCAWVICLAGRPLRLHNTMPTSRQEQQRPAWYSWTRSMADAGDNPTYGMLQRSASCTHLRTGALRPRAAAAEADPAAPPAQEPGQQRQGYQHPDEDHHPARHRGYRAIEEEANAGAGAASASTSSCGMYTKGEMCCCTAASCCMCHGVTTAKPAGTADVLSALRFSHLVHQQLTQRRVAVVALPMHRSTQRRPGPGLRWWSSQDRSRTCTTQRPCLTRSMMCSVCKSIGLHWHAVQRHLQQASPAAG